jgi:TfoX/Sxy family transcriptional regulator of competence genes
VAYDEDLANRVREILGPERGIEEKQMFGGLAFLINGNVSVMCVGASGQGGLVVRVRPDDTEKLLQREHVSVKVMGGREPRGWLHVATDGLKTKRQLQSWVTRGVEYAKTLRPKQTRGRRSRD